MIDVYQRITDRIVEQLEAGTVPWQKPWTSREAGMPQNLLSRKAYRGINVFLLACTSYASPYWITYKQAEQLGGHVRKGEKSMPVVFWRWIDKTDPETDEAQRIPLLRHYSVFNVAQCDLPADKVPEPEPADQTDNDFKPIEACESIVAEMPAKPTIHNGRTVACYQPSADEVCMPNAERFDDPAAYYSTLFHELTHATGHKSGLDRPGIVDVAAFGSRNYSKEELIAEMGAAFLSGHAGIENRTIDNSASYIAGWLQKLRRDHRLVVCAAAAAQKAADFILNRTFDSDSKPERQERCQSQSTISIPSN